MQFGYAISAAGSGALAGTAPHTAVAARLTGLTDGEARQDTIVGVDVTGLAGGETLLYQWRQGGTDIADATTADERIEIGTTHQDGQSLRCVVTIDGVPHPSDSAPVRFGPGTLSIGDQPPRIVDDTDVTLDASASGANLTFSHAAGGLPAGLDIDASTGAITGTPTAASSGTATVTATDQYGRMLQDTFAWSAALRMPATAANGLGDADWIVDDDVVNIAAATDFITNGNTLSYAIAGLPAGLSDEGDGTIGGTPTVDGQSGTVTITGTDTYGRQTTSGFTFTTAYRAQASAANGLGPFGWTVDDDTVSVDFAADFTANGNTLTYAATGLPAGVSMAPNGTLSGTPMAASSGDIVATGTDEYGRETTSTTSHVTALRAQASAANALADRIFTVGTAVDLDLTGDFTANGNTLGYAISGMPSGLVDDGDGSISGGATTASQSGSITITATDEYARQTSSGFGYTTQADTQTDTLAVTDEGDGTLTVTWAGTLTGLTVGGGGAFDGTYTTFHDGTALDAAHLDDVAGRALAILGTTGTGNVGETLAGGAYLVLHAQGAEPAVAIHWQRDGVDIPGATGTTYTPIPADAGADVRPVYTIASAGLTTVVETGSAVGVNDEAGAGGGVATHMGAQFAYADSANVGSVTRVLDVSGYTAGEKIIILYNGGGPSGGVSLTVGGSVPAVETTWDFGSERRGGLHVHTLTQPEIDAGTTDVVASRASGIMSAWSLDFLHTAGGSIADVRVIDNDSPVGSLTLTPTRAENTMFHWASGIAPLFAAPGAVYTSGVASRIYSLEGTSMGCAGGIIQDGAASANTIELALTGTGNFVQVAILVE